MSDEERIAVLSVHGVADQRPHATAAETARMLLHHNGGYRDGGTYGEFHKHEFQIPVAWDGEEAQPLRSCGLRDTVRRRIAQFRERLTVCRSIAQRCDEAEWSNSWTDEIMSAHQPAEKDAVYETVRFAGQRSQDDEGRTDGNTAAGKQDAVQQNTARQQIDVFEMHWADLSRAGKGPLSFLAQIYQLIAFATTLGSSTLEFTRQKDKRRRWNVLYHAQRIADILLTQPIIILNLQLLVVTLLVFPLHCGKSILSAADPGVAPGASGWIAVVGTAYIAWVGVAALAALALVKTGGWWIRRIMGPEISDMLGRWGWLRFSTLLGLPLAFTVWTWFSPWMPTVPLGFVLLAWGLAQLCLFRLVLSYDRRRPGSFEITLISSVLIGGYLLARGLLESGRFTPNSELLYAAILDVVVWTAEWIFAGLVTCWSVFFLCALVALFTGFFCRYAVKTRRAVLTAHLALAIPAMLLIIVTLSIWAVGVYFRETLLPAWILEHTHSLTFALKRLHLSPEVTVGSLCVELMNKGATTLFLIILASAAAALATAAALLWNGIMAEWQLPYRHDDSGVSHAQGETLNRSFRRLRFVASFLFIIVFLVWPASAAIEQFFPHLHDAYPEQLKHWSAQALTWLGLGLMITLTAPQLRPVAAMLYKVIDVVLDVANWLALFPKENNVRSRITARYVSMLRYLGGRDRNGRRRYDAVVVISHSQGTAITVEVLRYLEYLARSGRESEIRVDAPIYLMTMACPLRQLYGLRFPYLYDWARHEERAAGHAALSRPAIEDLYGVREWVNAYRSGDYVGRNLWRADDDPHLWQIGRLDTSEHILTQQTSDNRRRREFCIGAGAHTRYWESPLIAQELDRLIATAGDEAGSQQPDASAIVRPAA